jgi:hypothetical protein
MELERYKGRLFKEEEEEVVWNLEWRGGVG